MTEEKEAKAVKVRQKKEVQKVDNSPDSMIRLAIQGGADLEKVEKLLELQMRWEANEAKKAYDEAMSRVHANIPLIVKTKKNDQTRSMYADLEQIIIGTKKAYTDEGFSVSFYEGDGAKDGHVRICADVTHRLGHKQTHYYDVPLDGVGIKGNANMTAIHAKASSTSYGRRYLMCMIFNIPTGDDDDGTSAAACYITEDQSNEIDELLIASGVDRGKFLKWMGVDSPDHIFEKDHMKALNALKAKIKGAK